MTIKDGRMLGLEHPADTWLEDEGGIPSMQSVNVLINELAARRLGFEDSGDALGKTFHQVNGDAVFLEHRVAGVVSDANFLGFFNDIKPIIFIRDPESFRLASVRISGEAIPVTLNEIEKVWMRIIPAYPIQRQFLSAVFDDVFRIFTGINAALAVFAVLALPVALIGFFGLTAFMAEQPSKEVGICKVMAASVSRIVRLLIWQFSRPVLVAILLASPLGWLAAGAYLYFFAERVGLSPVFFISAGAIALLVAALAVSFPAIRVARDNPVHALRYE